MNPAGVTKGGVITSFFYCLHLLYAIRLFRWIFLRYDTSSRCGVDDERYSFGCHHTCIKTESFLIGNADAAKILVHSHDKRCSAGTTARRREDASYYDESEVSGKYAIPLSLSEV